LLSAWGLRFSFSSTSASLGLAFFSLGPLAFYALTLERGKAAPALRSLLAPWILFAALHLGVQLSGGLASLYILMDGSADRVRLRLYTPNLARVRELGGIAAIAISHAHFYSSK
jgi:hypothetical protein